MTDTPSPQELEARAERLQALRDAIMAVDTNGDRKLTGAEFADAFIKQYAALRRQNNPDDPDPLSQLREDLLLATQGKTEEERDIGRFNVTQELRASALVTPDTLRAELGKVREIAGTPTSVNPARTKTEPDSLTQAREAAAAEAIKNARNAGNLTPESEKAIRGMFGLSTRTLEDVAENRRLEGVISELRTQLSGYKQSDIGAPPNAQELLAAVNRASSTNERGGRQ
jgi:hypothetical protein